MRRQRITRKPIETELFPFLSVLACTIGTLILLIIVITSQTYGSDREVKIVVKSEQGTNLTKVPRYLEARVDGVIIHPQGTLIPRNELANSNSALTAIIAQVKQNRDREYFIVAVRPDAFAVFEDLRNIIEAEGISLGYEPLDKGWKLNVESANSPSPS
ncbi:MAG: hypothetical protein SAJ12_18550 [Jaaginema sp. PMC 1079.18]|nr:hypothetical protein [Jaaginema sp. PMC 1080.18]MEC4852986.1 hypothetical protein [Jaaginema sp. PMC 1079.18]MEC4865965.1 hypothetical protein [Jaaginema sp. PMC 1078.18]